MIQKSSIIQKSTIIKKSPVIQKSTIIKVKGQLSIGPTPSSLCYATMYLPVLKFGLLASMLWNGIMEI